MERLDEIRGRYTPGNYAFRDVGACTLQDISYLLAKLAEAQRREQAAVEDMYAIEQSFFCSVCEFDGAMCKNCEGQYANVGNFVWRGPQEAKEA